MRWKFNKVLNYIASGLMGLIIGLYFYTAITVFIAGSTDNYGSATMYLVMSILIIAYEVASEILIKKEKHFMVSWMPLVTITVLFVIMAGEYAMLGFSGSPNGTVNLALFLLSIIAILCENCRFSEAFARKISKILFRTVIVKSVSELLRYELASSAFISRTYSR